MNEIYLIVFLGLLVGFFALAGLIGEMRELDQREEQDRIRNAIHKDAMRNLGCTKWLQGERHEWR